MAWTVVMTETDFAALQAALLRPDGVEHAAFLYAGVADATERRRLLVKRIVPVADEDFGPSPTGTEWQIAPRALARAAHECDEAGLALVWAHSHPLARRQTGLSRQDHATIDRAHPHLLDLVHGRAVAALVLGRQGAAGQVWTPDGANELTAVRVVGHHIHDLRPSSARLHTSGARFARQVLLFGEAGQQVLRGQHVVVAGAGGGGSLILQSLAHLGVGRLTALDYDRVDESNLSRIVGAEPADAKVGTLKVDAMRRMVERIDPTIVFDGVAGDLTYQEDARAVADADFVFLATDTMFARFAFNAIVAQFLVPGIVVGAKIVAGRQGGLELVHVVDRTVLPGEPCLECAGAIDPDQLRREQASESERRAQRYAEGPGAEALAEPSVITLNSIATALATTDFQFLFTGLMPSGPDLSALSYYPLERALRRRLARPVSGCRWCDQTLPGGRFGAGDLVPLPLRPGRRS
jgi:hypothetical protein